MSSEFRSRRSSLTEEQVAFLLESGAFTSDELAATQASIARGELAAAEHATRTAAIKASLTASEVAALLADDEEGIERDRADGTLFAFTIDGVWRYPSWQFTSNPSQPVLPGMAVLASAFPADMHPASILGFMSTPQSSARVHGEPATPVSWLISGGDPEHLRGILESFLMS